ncbi:hypothetical protein cym2001_34110 [Pseudomonas sp. CYM-20-01]|nr:hypothetical protein cym2001_34110 [Pseudomonas sp. CYM-20-01]
MGLASWVEVFYRGHIRYLGNGYLWFRSYSGSLLKERKSKQNALAPTLGTSPRLGAECWGEAFLVTFGALSKVTRRKGGTNSRRYRDCQIFCVRAGNGLPSGRPCFYQVGLINRSP